jgi:hypothetical protein
MLDHPGSSPSFPMRRIMSRARTPTFVGLPRGGLGFRLDRTRPASRVTLGSSAAAVEAVSDDIWRHWHGPSKAESGSFKRISGTVR